MNSGSNIRELLILRNPILFTSLIAVTLLLTEKRETAAQEQSLQDLAIATSPLPTITLFTAKEVLTLDPTKPKAEAVAVVNDRILATGSLDELKRAAGDQPVVINEVFANQVIVPGFVAQHDHPLLAALTMTAEIIAIEDWVLPSGTVPAAKNRDQYLQRLADAEKKMANAEDVLLTWGYHHYFHGSVTRADLDKISAVRPIVVWHRSAHEFVVNTAALKKYGITQEFVSAFPPGALKQSNFENGHFWEQGAFAVMANLAPAIASPERLRAGLEFVEEYLHANGITIGCEPGGLASKKLQDAQNAVLSDSATPFRFYFIADGKSITATQPDEKVIAETEKLLTWGDGRTAYLPKQVKLFADGAIFSQAMQVREPYTDGHQGEWMMDLDFFMRSFEIYWNAGYQLHIHVNGDAGLDMVLNTLEENMRRHPRRDHRTVIVHFAVSQKDQVERIKRLGAVVSGNPYYTTALADNYSKVGLGPTRADQLVRMGDVERAGISFSYHSDMPMAPAQPLFLMHCGVNRTTMSGRIAAGDQRVSREGALRAVTLDAAYSLQLEKEVGSIEPGKLANFTILDTNPVTCDASKIKNIAVLGTVHEGRVFPIKNRERTAAVHQMHERIVRAAIEREGSWDSSVPRNGSCTCSTGKVLAAILFADEPK